ncbi:hypothetical protein BLOT_015177 [Blomia tropicalis]|nr:hypothetical protein BLOT_015177 [Blomia tropicalis]
MVNEYFIKSRHVWNDTLFQLNFKLLSSLFFTKESNKNIDYILALYNNDTIKVMQWSHIVMLQSECNRAMPGTESTPFNNPKKTNS